MYIDWEGKIILSFLTNDIIVQAENLKELGKKSLQEIMSNNNKVVKYKVNTQKSIAFLYVSNEKMELEIKKHN